MMPPSADDASRNNTIGFFNLFPANVDIPYRGIRNVTRNLLISSGSRIPNRKCSR